MSLTNTVFSVCFLQLFSYLLYEHCDSIKPNQLNAFSRQQAVTVLYPGSIVFPPQTEMVALERFFFCRGTWLSVWIHDDYSNGDQVSQPSACRRIYASSRADATWTSLRRFNRLVHTQMPHRASCTPPEIYILPTLADSESITLALSCQNALTERLAEWSNCVWNSPTLTSVEFEGLSQQFS